MPRQIKSLEKAREEMEPILLPDEWLAHVEGLVRQHESAIEGGYKVELIKTEAEEDG